MEASEVLLPSMGEGINEATLVKWLKKDGEPIAKDEPLLEVSTDKVDTEIPAPYSGFLLKTNVSEGSTVEINSVIAWIGPEGATIPESKKVERRVAKAAPSSENPKAHSSTQNLRQPSHLQNQAAVDSSLSSKKSSPLVRKMAKDYGIDLRRVLGTGLHGRITKDDMHLFLSSPHAFTTHEPAPLAAPQELLARVETSFSNDVEVLEGVTVRREKMSKMRRLIAEHMVESVRHSPHVTTTFEIDLHKVVQMREAHKKSFLEKEGFNLTFTHILIRAAVEAIKAHPIVNVSVDGDEILWKDQINIGCAVALGQQAGGGLIVPVIKNAQNMKLSDIARKLNDLATRARNKKLSPDEVVGGTFSVTNPGGWGSIHSNPIINQPQVAMLGIGAVVKRPVVIENDQIVIRPMMMASLTFDHRVIDGEGGAQWLLTYKNLLENWSETPN